VGQEPRVFLFFSFFSFFVLTDEFASVMYEKEKQDCRAHGRAT